MVITEHFGQNMQCNVVMQYRRDANQDCWPLFKVIKLENSCYNWIYTWDWVPNQKNKTMLISASKVRALPPSTLYYIFLDKQVISKVLLLFRNYTHTFIVFWGDILGVFADMCQKNSTCVNSETSNPVKHNQIKNEDWSSGPPSCRAENSTIIS